VVGLVSLDRVDGGAPRLGGAACYAARALRFLGHPALIATKVGDAGPALALQALGLPVAWHRASRAITFRIDYDGEERRLVLEETGDPFTPADVREWLGASLGGSDWVHAWALTRADFPPETLAALRRGRRVSFDGQGLRIDDRSLGSLGVPEIVVTLGRRGAVVYADGLAEHVRARPVEGIDPTGAGDEFIAAYLSYRRRGHGPPSAARCANDAVAALLERCHRRGGYRRNSPRATTTAEPPTSTRSIRSGVPSARA
jgi:sugar/nucleoside kinase (ribokinase family)